jgi:hypothetical protein
VEGLPDVRLSASVSRVIGKCKYYIATISNQEVVPMEEIPAPSRVEIECEDGCCFLYHYDANGACIADDWFETVDQAKGFAKVQFDIGESDWAELA